MKTKETQKDAEVQQTRLVFNSVDQAIKFIMKDRNCSKPCARQLFNSRYGKGHSYYRAFDVKGIDIKGDDE